MSVLERKESENVVAGQHGLMYVPDAGERRLRRRRLPRLRFLLGRLLVVVFVTLLLSGLLAGALLAYHELQTSELQSRWLSEFSRSIVYELREGPARRPLPADQGPFDRRLGYARLDDTGARLLSAGYRIQSQARPSRRMAELAEQGFFNVYREKTRAGLEMRDMNGNLLHKAAYPRRVYADFDAVPQLLVDALLYVEDRDLLDSAHPNRNPVIDWERLLKAASLQGMKILGREQKVIGGSTLATQLEKFRHAPDGITRNARDKLMQMGSASLRVYRQGPRTLQTRRRLLVDYVNSLPLAAQPGFGEVNGIGDGLEAWFGSSFDEANAALADPKTDMATRGRYYKQVLALILSVRRPSYYLGQDSAALAALCDSYLRRMGQEGMISVELRNAALAAPLTMRTRAVDRPLIDFTQQKGSNLARTRLLSLLGVPSFYELDRYDLGVRTSLDAAVQQRVTDFLNSLREPARIRELGLGGARLLHDSDPGRVIYSLTLYERAADANLLRVNADNLDQPLDINAGARLDLGSTAKLRTLISWLELIAEVRERYAALSEPELAAQRLHPRDRLSAWVLAQMLANPRIGTQQLLEAAMMRNYSASTAETFFTGGGAHRFENFERADNVRVLSVAEALRRSVNLVFIRLMREVIDHYMYRAPSTTARLLENAQDPARGVYLERFADREGQVYLRRFFAKYHGKPASEAREMLLESAAAKPRAIAVALRSAWPDADGQELHQWIARFVPDARLDERRIEQLYEKYAPERFSLNDRGYLARVHPLELWLVAYLQQNPDASMTQVMAASETVRQEVYAWLMKTSRRRAQDRRIRDLLEIEAFEELHQQWQKLGYPFAALTPSLATAIGSSGDRPAALAELMGIVVNGGIRTRTRLIESLHFAADTPYEVRFDARESAPEHVMRAEVARVVRTALIDVVENGTARAVVARALRSDGSRHVIGGKTGTGDHRYEIYSAPGRLVESRVVNRVATFVFMIDDRFFGTITAFVPGAEAAQYEFTSGLPVRLLGALMPVLAPLLERTPDSAASDIPEAMRGEIDES